MQYFESMLNIARPIVGGVATRIAEINIGRSAYDSIIANVRTVYKMADSLIGCVVGRDPQLPISVDNPIMGFVSHDRFSVYRNLLEKGLLTISVCSENQKFMVLIGPGDNPEDFKDCAVLGNVFRALSVDGGEEIPADIRAVIVDGERKERIVNVSGVSSLRKIATLTKNANGAIAADSEEYQFRFVQFNDFKWYKDFDDGRRFGLIEIIRRLK